MMRIDEISKAAAYNKPAPKYASAPETLLYLSLKALYADFKKGYIDKQSAADTKARIVAKCEEYEKAYNDYLDVYKAYQDNIKKGHDLIDSIEKAKNVFEIAAHACELVGLYTNDENFAKRQSKKIKE